MKYHSELCNTITDDLLQKCEAYDIISKDYKAEIDAIPSTQEKNEKFLEKIAESLEKRYTNKFFQLLVIMQQHGSGRIKQLAIELEALAFISSDDDDDENKGNVKVQKAIYAHTLSG